MLSKLSKIDQLTINDHWHLTDDDDVWYIGEYSSGKGYGYSPANQLIANLKHGVEFRTNPPTGPWYYKLKAIGRVGQTLAACISREAMDRFTFVPIPPSVAKSDARFDSRNLDMLNSLKHASGQDVDVRELLFQCQTTRSSHLSDARVTIDELTAAYRVDESLADPEPTTIVLFDDVLTTGAHYVAAKRVMLNRSS